MKQACLVLLGGVLGGLLGYFGFFWLLSQGFYALVLPGALVGIGAGLFSNRMLWPVIVCGLGALGVGVFAEWRFAPFAQDNGLLFFLAHIHELKPMTLLMIVVGGLIGFWGPYSRYRREAADRREARVRPSVPPTGGPADGSK